MGRVKIKDQVEKEQLTGFLGAYIDIPEDPLIVIEPSILDDSDIEFDGMSMLAEQVFKGNGFAKSFSRRHERCSFCKENSLHCKVAQMHKYTEKEGILFVSETKHFPVCESCSDTLKENFNNVSEEFAGEIVANGL